jgi:hypothetical protein
MARQIPRTRSCRPWAGPGISAFISTWAGRTSLTAATRSISTRITWTCSGRRWPAAVRRRRPRPPSRPGGRRVLPRRRWPAVAREVRAGKWLRDLGGQLSSGPAPAVSGRGTLTVFWTGRDGQLWVIRRKPRSSWTHPANLGMGRLVAHPRPPAWPAARSMCWPAKSHTSVWQLSFSPGHGWGKTHGLSAGVSAGPVAVAAPATGVDVFWRGSNGTLWWAAGHGASWTQPTPLGMGYWAARRSPLGSPVAWSTCSGRAPLTGTYGRPGTGAVPGPGRPTWAARSADRHGERLMLRNY